MAENGDKLIHAIVLAFILMAVITAAIIIGKNIGKKAKLFFSVVITLVIGAALALVPYAANCVEAEQDMFFAKRAEASVVSVKHTTSEIVDEDGESAGYTDVYKTTVEYLYDGEKHEGVVELSDKKDVGDNVTVYVFAEDKPIALDTLIAAMMLIKIIVPLIFALAVFGTVINIYSVMKKDDD